MTQGDGIVNTNPVLSEKIRQYRKMYGMTQEELASAVGVEPLHISNIERGKKGISLDMMLLICKCFDIGLDDLLPTGEHEGTEMKAKWISEINETLDRLEYSKVGLIKTMVCSLDK